MSFSPFTLHNRFVFLQLTELYRNSLVGDSFERLEIEAFSKGSILVDYYVSFKEFEGQVTTSVLKEVLNQQFEGQDGSSKLGRFTIDPTFTDFYGKNKSNFFQFRIVDFYQVSAL